MDLSKIQIIALCIVTTILTDKFLINKPVLTSNSTPNQVVNLAPTQVPVSSASAAVAGISSQNETILRELINLRKDKIQLLQTAN
jgi:hypothetical protein